MPGLSDATTHTFPCAEEKLHPPFVAIPRGIVPGAFVVVDAEGLSVPAGMVEGVPAFGTGGCAGGDGECNECQCDPLQNPVPSLGVAVARRSR